MNERPIFETGENQFGWLPDGWFCGVPDQRCRYCGRPVIFVPASLAIESCTCGVTNVSPRAKPATRRGANATRAGKQRLK